MPVPRTTNTTPRAGKRRLRARAAVVVSLALGSTGMVAWAAAQPGRVVPVAATDVASPRRAAVPMPSNPPTQARGASTLSPGSGGNSPAAHLARPATPSYGASTDRPLLPSPTPLRDRDLPYVSEFTPEVVANIRRIAGRAPNLRDDVFVKMGGSSIVSQAYLHCFAGREIDLGGREELRETIDFFRATKVQRRSSFRRISEAAGVGWSLRQGMAGRPSKVQRELRQMRPRYALAFFGGNDVQGRNERVYARRLISLVEQLTHAGVVPILGAIQPRRDREMHPWVRRYNRITRAVAEAWELPYVDFHGSTVNLDYMGLAGDGVHPNVYRPNTRHVAACDFTEAGLSAGFNVRNLLTLEALDSLRRIVSEGEAAPAPSPPPLVGDGSIESPARITGVPFATRITPTAAVLDGYQGCEASGAPGPERIFRVDVTESTRVRATVVPRGDGVTASIYHLGEEVDADACRGGGTDHSLFTLEPGVHHFAIEVRLGATGTEGPVSSDTAVLFALTRE